jgi:serine/threonine protein kinase
VNQSSFAFVEKISESGTTTVYKAHQNVLERTVLLKVLHKHLLRDQNLVSRFSREAKACAILQCENIAQVYDLTEIDGAPAIVMEYVEGRSLEEILLEGMHSLDLTMRVAASVLKALAYAHGKGVVHRDIKPGNILVSSTGVIKVTDFGLAAVTNAPTLTLDGSLIGTPAYMSPEQARGETVDGRTDLFSLGITLIETLTGKQILAGKSYAECIGKIQNFNLQSIDRFVDGLTPSMREFMKGLLAPNRENRFPSSEEALRFLESFSEGEKTSTSVGPDLSRKRRRKFAIAASGFILILGSITTIIVVSKTSKNIRIEAGSPFDSSASAMVKGVPLNNDRLSDFSTSNRGNMRTIPDQSQVSRAVSATGKSKDARKAATKDSGYVSITCNPWAEVDIDSEYVGRTPIAGSILVPAGKHTLTFSNPIFEPIVKQVEVWPKTLSTVQADFMERAGYVFLTVSPWGDVYIDDQKRDTTPLSKPIIVSAGLRKLRIHNPSFHDIVENLKVVAGDTLRLSFSFQKNEEK